MKKIIVSLVLLAANISINKNAAAQPSEDVSPAVMRALFSHQMQVCWAGIEDLPDPERLTVTLRVSLLEDGTLIDEPVLVHPKQLQTGDRFMSIAVDRAKRAIRRCQPYQLPAGQYEDWKELTLSFGAH